MTSFLDSVVAYLQRNQIELDTGNQDGRINSIRNEDEVLKHLIKEFPAIKIPNIRCWWDFGLDSKEDELFVNIKISDFNNHAADNISAKLGMGYALTGIKKLPMSWSKFHKILAEELKIGYDYYFLVINKNDTRDSFWTSLKRIDTLVPNGNNLPFQCDWAKNRSFSTRSEIEAMKYILSVYIKSWDKKTERYPHNLKEMLLTNRIFDTE